MAPRSTKANKKATDVKVVADVELKKSRSRAKAVADPEIEPETDDILIDEKVAVGKKTKPKRKGEAEEQEHTNGDAPAAKKGRKKAVKAAEVDNKNTEETNIDFDEPEQATEQEEVQPNGNGVSEEADPALNGKGKKKPAKKAEAKPTRGRKQAKPEVDEDEEEPEVAPLDDKPAPAERAKGRGRGHKPAAKPDKEAEEVIEESKSEPAAKGRKKAQPKAVKPTASPEPEIAEELAAEEVAEGEEVAEVEAELPEKEKKEAKLRTGKKGKPVNDVEPASKKRKINKKEDNAKGDAIEVEDEEEIPEEDEVKPAKGKRGAKKPVEKGEEGEPQQSESTTKRRRKVDNEEKEEIKSKGPLKNKSSTNYDDIDFASSSKTPQGKDWNFKIASWNVDGIRAWFTKGGLDYIKHEKPDILCLQEVKCSKDKLPEDIINLPGYHAYWLCSDKDGYAGVGIYTTKLAMNVTYGLQNEELDSEGRIITAEYEDFYLICTYVPNAGRKLVTLPKRLQWNQEFRKYVRELDEKKPVIICGDMNVAHNEIDLANPKTNKKNAGFTVEERTGMTELLSDGFVDTYRHFNPDKTGAYTFWTYMMSSRAKNLGWRLDYFLVSKKLVPSVCDNVIRDGVYGSDHCPIALFLHLTSAEKPKE